MKLVRLENKKFGKLTVLGRAKDRYTKSGHRVIYYMCKCDCQKEIEVRGVSLTRKDRPTKSCGCLQRERMGLLKREKSPSWKGGERIESGGYVEVYMPNHPKARKTGYIKKHRLIMEKKIGRYLLPEENVHHINGDKFDNRIENLELWNISQPSGQRVKDKVEWAKRILKIYE